MAGSVDESEHAAGRPAHKVEHEQASQVWYICKLLNKL